MKIPQLFYEVIWDTTPFNDQSEWPEDGSQPFVWSFGDATGYGNHGDYMFGWKGDALQIAMDTNCNGDRCPELEYQEIKNGNQCTKKPALEENLSGCKFPEFPFLRFLADMKIQGWRSCQVVPRSPTYKTSWKYGCLQQI